MFASKEGKRSGMGMFKTCWAHLYVSNGLFGDMKLSWTSSSSSQRGQISFSKVLQARKRNVDTFSVKNNRSTQLKGYRNCPECCQGRLRATIAVRSPGLCQPHATPARQAWRNASKTTPSSSSYTPRSFVINLLIDGHS